MDKIKQFFSSKSVGWYLTLASLVLFIATLIVYCVGGRNEFTPELDAGVIAVFALAIAANVAVAVFEFRYGKFAVYLLGLIGFLEYIASQVNYIANIAVSIDGTAVSAAFVLTIVFGLAATVLMLVSAILQKNIYNRMTAAEAGSVKGE